MGTIIRDRNLLAILKGAEALARELAPRYPWLFAEQPQPTTEEAANDSIVVLPPAQLHQRPAALVRSGGPHDHRAR